MKRRELAGHINKAQCIYLWVPYSTEGMWLQVPRTLAREVVADAKETGVTEIEARIEKGELLIGCDGLVDDSSPAGEGAAEGEAGNADDEAEELEEETDD